MRLLPALNSTGLKLLSETIQINNVRKQIKFTPACCAPTLKTFNLTLFRIFTGLTSQNINQAVECQFLSREPKQCGCFYTGQLSRNGITVCLRATG